MNSLSVPKKVDYNEYVKTTCMFYINSDYEKNTLAEVQKDVETLCQKMKGIFAPGGLEEYIKTDPKSLDNLISLMNISSEKFKRVITMLRIEKGHVITGEWDLNKIRNMMIERKEFMNEVCELLRNGVNDPKYQNLIPPFYLENFVIDSSTMARLSNPDDLKRLIKKGVEGKYNNGIGDAYFKDVQEIIDSLCFDQGLTYVCNKDIPLLGRSAHFAIPNEHQPRIIIDISYNITTSSTQTRFKDQEEKAAQAIRNYNQSHDHNIVLINILDGAGWVGRQADFRAIHRCSAYALHLSTLFKLKEILQYYC